MSLTAPTFNSVSIVGTVATLNCTPPVDAEYDHSQIFYRLKGGSNYIAGATFIGTQGLAENQTQPGLIDGKVYEFALAAADSEGRYSELSVTRIKWNTTSISEKNLFLINAMILLSNCPSFQTFTNTDDADAALERIHSREINLYIENTKFPCAVIYFEGDARTTGQANIMNTDISLKLIEECKSDRDRDEKLICDNHLNIAQKIIHEIRQLQGVDDYLIIPETEESQEPTFLNLTDDLAEETQDYIFSIFILKCGVQ